MTALDYFLKANLNGLLFVGCYWLFLRRHTFLNLNRTYLLLSAVLSLVLPLASLPTETAGALPGLDWPVPIGVIALPVSVVATAPAEPTGPDWMLLSAWGYGLVVLFLLLRLAMQLGRVLRLIRQSPQQVRGGYVMVLPHSTATPTFSFFRYVVLNPADVRNDLILQHELVHVRQRHSADRLGLAILRAAFWPVLSLALVERALRHVHEFLADRAASGRAASGRVASDNQSISHQRDYARFLVEYTFGVRPDSLTNGFFNPSLLKQRILMLHQRATNRWALGKYVLVLPLAFSLLAMTTTRENIVAVVEQATDETITVSGKVLDLAGKPLPGTSVMDGKRVIQTDINGHFQLAALQSPATLMFSRMGFESVMRKITSATVLSITLRQTQDTLPAIGATSDYKAVKPNPEMPNPTLPNSQTINGQVYSVVEQQPLFPGGIPALMQYIANNLRYPADARRANVVGRVFVQFVVTETGAIHDLRILKGIGFGCDEEAVRVVSQMPKWIPGKQNGKPVAVMYNLPILFELEKREDKRTGQADQQYEPVFKPTNSPIGASPTTRAKDFPNQPRLNTVTVSVPATTISGRGPLGPLGDKPLYIIDGKETSADSVSMDTKNIESVSVLKDASAGVYGEKGKNGVVIITTKKP